MMKMSARGWALLALMAVAWLPELAHAAPNFFTPVAGDKSISQFLRPLFGSLFGGSSGGVFESAVGILNGAALTIGAIFVAYTLIAGTMQTAHDGEMLGKRWSSMWVPIRTALGVALVVPIGGGFCVAQMLIAWFVTQGVGLADMVWSNYANAAFSMNGFAPRSSMPAVEDLARGMLKSQVCMQGNNKTQIAAGANNMYSVLPMANNSGFSYGNAAGVGAECGAVNYKFSTQKLTNNGVYTDAMGVSITVGESANIATTLETAHINASNTLNSSMQNLAVMIVNGTPTDASTMATFQTAVETYQNTVATAAAAAVTSANTFAQMQQSATQDGWIMAGAWFMRAVALQDAVTKRVSQAPSTTPPTNINDSEGSLKLYYARLNTFLSYTPNQFGITNEAAMNNGGGTDQVDIGTSMFDVVGKAVKSFVGAINEWIFKQLFQVADDRHPLMGLKSFGDTIMGAATIGILVGGGASIMLNFAGNLALLFAVPMFAFGAGIAIYLPFLPFLIFFGAALGWLLLVAEAIIAAPLWAVMHLSPSGDDVMGGAKGGYMMILGLMLRPALMIFGLICAIIACETVIRVFNMIFYPVFKAAMADSLMGLGSMIVMTGIYFGTMMSLFHKLFGLIHVVPDQIMRWMGGDSSNLGGTAGELANQGRQQMLGATAAATGAAQQGANLARNRAQEKLMNTQKESSGRTAAIQEKTSLSNASSGAFGALGEANAARAAADGGSNASASVASLGKQVQAYESNANQAQQYRGLQSMLQKNDPKGKNPDTAQKMAEYGVAATKHETAAKAAMKNAEQDLGDLSATANAPGAKSSDARASRNAAAMVRESGIGRNNPEFAKKAETMQSEMNTRLDMLKQSEAAATPPPPPSPSNKTNPTEDF